MAFEQGSDRGGVAPGGVLDQRVVLGTGHALVL
jgi:hypothetical protein